MATVDIQSLVDDNAAVARVQVQVAGGPSFSRTSSAKKHPSDPPVRTVGESLALARALRALADDLELYATETSNYHIELAKMDKVLIASFSDAFDEADEAW